MQILKNDSHSRQFTKSRKTGQVFSLVNRPLTSRENAIKGQTLNNSLRLAVSKNS